MRGLNTLVEKYPGSEVSKIAGMIINGVKSGKRLRGARFDIGNIWAIRNKTLSDSAQLKAKPLSPERNTQFVFMLAYQPGSVNENKLLYQVAKYNFTSYLVRDFDIAIDDDNYLHRLRVSGFRNYDEALLYSRGLLAQTPILKLMGKARPFIISTENLPLIGVAYSYEDYKKFYDVHFAPIKPSTLQLLNEPESLMTEPQEPDSLQDDGLRNLQQSEEYEMPIHTEAQPQGMNPSIPQQKTTTPQAKKPAQQEKKTQPEKKKTFNIESEDYELEGF